MGGAMLSKSEIQFSFYVQGSVSSLLFDLRLNYGGGNEDNGDLLQIILCSLIATNPVASHFRHIPLLETPGHS